MNLIRFNYKDIEKYCLKIYEQITKTNYSPDYIVAISVGGLFPAIHFARLFNTRNLTTIGINSYFKKKQNKIKIINLPEKKLLKNKKILLVDDISDTGKTIEFVVNLLKKEYKVKDIKTATIFVNKINCKYYSDYYYKEVNKWVFFPWDIFKK